MLTCKEIYQRLFQRRKEYLESLNVDKHLSDSTIVRLANIDAVRQTVKVWREQKSPEYNWLHEPKRKE